jgi:hypothetical protein
MKYKPSRIRKSGIVVMNATAEDASKIVKTAIDAGVSYLQKRRRVSLSSGFPLHNRYESRLADPAVLKF